MKPHGDYVRYSTGCRCGACREAWRRHRKLYRKKLRSMGLSDKRGDTMRVDAAKARRNVVCLLSFGVSRRRLAAAMAVNRSAVQFIERGKSKRVKRETEAAVEQLHWKLWLGHGGFRSHCRCEEMPEWVRTSWEAA
jgi:hypothetical protein